MRTIKLDELISLDKLLWQFPERKNQSYNLPNNDVFTIILSNVTLDTLEREEYLTGKEGSMITPNYAFSRPRFLCEAEQYEELIEEYLEKSIGKHLKEQEEMQETLDSISEENSRDTNTGYAYLDVMIKKHQGLADDALNYRIIIQGLNNSFSSVHSELDYDDQEQYMHHWFKLDSINEKLENELMDCGDYQTIGPLIVPTNKLLLKEINFGISHVKEDDE